ncbi:hypothetical protein FE257_001098 [Aspergillus nanangensis]|uniref:FAD-binding domain-containing protein n=1 Tax=Aspergillus nanangensis TaxID=2582783 RepID=A0AAD4CTZ8_ASPNN|nr:hypothetical protein FE257_001098 [Aspergillus nanangensis]
MKIVIIGAGISGCTAYLLLKKHLPSQPLEVGQDSHSITIYEAHDTNKDTTPSDRRGGSTHSSTLVVGGGLGIGPNGLNVIQRLDETLLHNIVRGGYAVSTSNLKTKNGTLLMQMSATEDAAPGRPAMHMVGSSRHSLWRCIQQRVPDRDIVTTRVSKVVANRHGRNEVHFADGSDSVEADLVIGADGVKGIVKRAIFPGEEEDPYPPQYEGLVGIGGFVSTDGIQDHIQPGSMNFILGGNGFFGYFFSESAPSAPERDSPYHISPPGNTLTWWSTYSASECPDPTTLDIADVARQLQTRHAQWKDPVIQRILGSCQVQDVYPTWTSPALPTWERDGVVLVGDAAHALPPTSGQGSSQALEDVEAFALLLSHFLREQKPANEAGSVKHVISMAARKYMELRRPRVEEILADARKRQNKKRDMTVVEEVVMYCAMWIIGCFPGFASGPLKKLFSFNMAEEVERALGQ